VHLYLTDRLTCPRCGPEFGLLLLAREVRNRRGLGGDLGCANCRETYPVKAGLGGLRPPPRKALSSPSGVEIEPERPVDPEQTMRLGALLGVAEGPGTLFIRGPAARHAEALADLISQVEVVAVDPLLQTASEREGVSRFAMGARIPFFSSSFRGVLLDGPVEEVDLEEAARVVVPSGRVVILHGGERSSEALDGLGLSVILEEDGVVVAERERKESPPLVTLRGP